jgi:hypothetical protein
MSPIHDIQGKTWTQGLPDLNETGAFSHRVTQNIRKDVKHLNGLDNRARNMG